MKIISLTAENIKKIVAVQITPDGNLVQITGKNGHGKTSVLDCIWLALDIAGASHKTTQPIRKGEKKARIELKLGTDTVQLIVERRFTESGDYLEVRTADGAEYKKKQHFLDDLLGALTFDPLEFMRDRKGQFDVLKNLVALDIDLDAAATADKFDYQERTRVNREAKAKRAQAAGITLPENLPAAAIDEDALMDEYERANAHNMGVDQKRYLHKRAAAVSEQDRSDAKKLREKAAALISEAAALETQADARDKELAAEGAPSVPLDIAAIRARLDFAKLVNGHLEARERRTAIEAEAAQFEKKSDELTAAIDARAAQRVAAIAAAKMPVAGLGFGDGVVLFEGLPLDQASDAEQLMISTAIAAALNPKLRVLRIRDGSLLDDDAMLRLAKFADDHDFQIWVERVDGSGTVGIVMEDGHVRGQSH